MLLGYNTNGLAHHALHDAFALISEIGYRSVAITLDHGALDPYSTTIQDNIRRARDQLRRLELRNVIETGARFLLDPREKHSPTLMDARPEARQRRIDFLKRAIDVAVELDSDAVSLWSGKMLDDADVEAGLERLAEGLSKVLEHAANSAMEIAFEPEPGMFIDTMAKFTRMLEWIDGPHLKLTIDVGHLYCQGEMPIADYIARYASRLANVHIEDMRAGVHEHLMFGEGEMNFPPIIQALKRAGYSRGLHVELSRHSHEGPVAARKAFEFLGPLVTKH